MRCEMVFKNSNLIYIPIKIIYIPENIIYALTYYLKSSHLPMQNKK